MKELHLWITLVAAIPLFAGCNEKASTETAPRPLSFSTVVEPQTRATDLTTDNITSMGVLAYHTQGGDFNASTSTPNFMYNEKITKSGSTWTYSPVKYWPASNDRLSFFAYAPHADNLPANDRIGISTNTTVGYPAITFTNNTGETDLLLSTPLLNKNGGEVSFSLKHALAKVSFYVKNGDATTGKKLHSFSIRSRKSGKYAFNASAFVYSAANADMREDALATVPVDIPSNTTDKVLLETLYIHPDRETNISLTYSINGNDANTVVINNQKVPATPALVSGANINYTITINNDGYTITASNETEWTQASDDKITYYTADDLKMGDYYYSDGTWSDGGVRMLNQQTAVATLANPLPQAVPTNPDTGATRTCIGVVFYVGKHPTDDCMYPTAMNGNVNGYVVSLDNVGAYFDGGGWTSYTNGGSGLYLVGASTDVSDYKGYGNTHLIESTAKAKNVWSNPPFHLPYMVLNNYNVAAPAACSGWYMPSIGQVKDLHKYKTAIQAIMANLNKSMVGGSGNGGTYWSSTEVNASNAYKFDNFTGSGKVSSYSKSGRDATRPVLTF